MTIFRMVLDAVNVLVPLLTAWDGAHVRLFIVAHPISVTVPETTKTKLVSFKLTNHPHTSDLLDSVFHDELGTKLLGRPRVIAVLRLGQHRLFVAHGLAAGRCAAPIAGR